jgi:hypothetical protein
MQQCGSTNGDTTVRCPFFDTPVMRHHVTSFSVSKSEADISGTSESIAASFVAIAAT